MCSYFEALYTTTTTTLSPRPQSLRSDLNPAQSSRIHHAGTFWEYTITMPALRSTIDRLDRPSSYATAKVRLHKPCSLHTRTDASKQKRRKNRDDDERGPTPEVEDKLKDATTLYVGNLSFYTTEEQIHELFSKYVNLIPALIPLHYTSPLRR